jgi:predicted Holliday junction resolvase-like endonuclease
MNTVNVIKDLRKSNLYAECPCGESFLLKDALLFDGTLPFPAEALPARDILTEELKERILELKKRHISADAGAEKKAIEVGVGKCLEKIVPACRDFTIPLADCRPLFEPIDLLAFNGLTGGRITSLTFLEIKTGDAKLNKHQKKVKEAVEDKDVSVRWYK